MGDCVYIWMCVIKVGVDDVNGNVFFVNISFMQFVDICQVMWMIGSGVYDIRESSLVYFCIEFYCGYWLCLGDCGIFF